MSMKLLVTMTEVALVAQVSKMWKLITLLMLDKENPKVTKSEWKRYNKRLFFMMFLFVLILFFTVLSFYVK